MAENPYIGYNKPDEFYTIPALCNLFQMDKQALRAKCEQNKIRPHRNEIGEHGFVKYDVRDLLTCCILKIASVLPKLDDP